MPKSRKFSVTLEYNPICKEFVFLSQIILVIKNYSICKYRIFFFNNTLVIMFMPE